MQKFYAAGAMEGQGLKEQLQGFQEGLQDMQ